MRAANRDEPGGCSAEDFNFLIRRERARVDRGHGAFCLVVFSLMPDRKLSTDRRLVDVLKNRTRITDSVGWMNDSSLGVLLADASRAGGASFLNDVLPLIKEIPAGPECQIYTYPTDNDECGDSSLFATRPVGAGVTDTEKVLNEMVARNPSIGRQILERSAAGFAVLLLSPLLLLIALAIKRNSPGPVLYRQVRIGHKGKPFRCYKFRTMNLNAATDVHANHFKKLIESDLPMRKLDSDDPRIFRAGLLLRSSSLDELPQLFNILNGDMSFIGPRPAIPGEYKDYFPWHRSRVDVLPGLTGLWQVNGKNKTTFTEMMRLDRRYSLRQSLWLDVRIVLKTVPVVISQFIEHHHSHTAALEKMTENTQLRPTPDQPTLEDA